jgi:peptidoglycan/xylan/chitin deacetylase (PgdA/CDA1 family)
MNKTFGISIIAVIAVSILAAGMFSANNLTKAQQTKSGVVTIAFDDGDQNQFDYAYPLLQQYGMAGTFYVITSDVGTSGFLNVTELQTMQASGMEIGSHSVTHPDFETLTNAQINYQCNASQQFLQSNGLSAVNFAYPYGYTNSAIDSIVLQYYRSARYSYDADWRMPIPPTGTQMSIPMGFAGEASSVTTALIQDELAVKWAQEYNCWVIMFFHNVVPDATEYLPYGIDTGDFSTLLGYIANSGVNVLTVNQALNLWSTPQRVIVLPSSSPKSDYPYLSTTMDVGQSQTFTAIDYGGTSPYSYQWYLNDGTVGSNSTSYTFDALSAGTFSSYVNATDSSITPVTSQSNIESITVNSAPVAPIASASMNKVDQGQICSLTSSDMSTGSPPYSYNWLEKAPGADSYSLISGATSQSYSFVTSGSTTTGAWSFELQVTDSASTPVVVTSSVTSVTVNVAPTVSLSPTYWAIDVGQGGKTFTATASGGSGSFTSYQWYVDGTSQSGQTASTFSFAPGSVGSYSITATATDSLGATSAQSSAALVTVNSAPTVTLSPTSWTMDAGQQKTFSANPSSGSGVYSSYQWYLGGVAQPSQNAKTFRYTPTFPGSYSITVTVTDSLGVTSAQSPAASVTLSTSPTVTVVPLGPLAMDLGQVQVYTAMGIGGSDTLSYQWYLDGTAVSGANSTSYSYTAALGSHLVTCKVTDSASSPVTSPASNAVSVTVNTAQTASVTPASATWDVGQSQTFTCAASGGTGTLHYQWYLAGAAVSGQTGTTYIYMSGSAGSATIHCKVTDSASTPYEVQSNTATITVNSALVAPTVTATPGTINQGQNSSLTSTAVSTGTSPYTYQWLQKAPGAGSYSSISGATSISYNFVISNSTAIGTWNFELQVTDSTGIWVNSTAIAVAVNPTIFGSAGPGGSISPIGSVSVNYNDSQTFTIKANSGYSIADVTVNGTSVGDVNSYTFNNVQAADTIFATFVSTPTPSPSPSATSAPASTPKPTLTPTPTKGLPNHTPTPTPTLSPNQTLSKGLHLNATFGILVVVVAAAIVGAVLILIKSKKGKS